MFYLSELSKTMIEPNDAQVTSVTCEKNEHIASDPFDFLAYEAVGEAELALIATEVDAVARVQSVADTELDAQARHDLSASAEKVKELLNAAKNNGMTQKDFELRTAKLRPGRAAKVERSAGWNGTLWHHYYVTGAKMKLLSFSELIDQLEGSNWLSHHEAMNFGRYSLAKFRSVINARECKTPTTRGEAGRRYTEFLESIGLYSFHDPKDV